MYERIACSHMFFKLKQLLREKIRFKIGFDFGIENYLFALTDSYINKNTIFNNPKIIRFRYSFKKFKIKERLGTLLPKPYALGISVASTVTAQQEPEIPQLKLKCTFLAIFCPVSVCWFLHFRTSGPISPKLGTIKDH